MKQIVDFGKHSKLVLEDEKDTKDFIKFEGCLILLWPIIGIIGFAISCYLVYLLLSLPEWLISL